MYDVLLEEYKSLRTEIMKRQDARLYIAGFTMAAIGTILGLTLRDGVSIGHESNYYVTTLAAFAFVVLNAALILTIQYTQQIDVISGYIRKFIEPKIPEMGWETRWTRYRELRRTKDPTFLGFPWGTSRALALFYALLTVAVCFVIFMEGVYHVVALILVPIATSSFLFSYDLFEKRTKGWKIDWGIIANNTVENKDAQQRIDIRTDSSRRGRDAMEAPMTAIEVMGTVDEQHQLWLDESLPIPGPTRVRVIVLFPAKEVDEIEWL